MSARVEARPSVDWTLVTRVAPAVLVVSGTLLFAPFPSIRASIDVPLAVGQLGPAWAVLDLVAGLLLLLAGIGAWLSGLPLRLGLLATFAGLAWYGPDLFALRSADPLVRLAGSHILAPLLWPLLIHLGAAQLGLDMRRDVRTLLVVLYGATVLAVVIGANAYEPFWDPWCLDCQWDNPLVAGNGATAAGRGIPAWLRLGSVVLALAVGTVAAWSIARGSQMAGVSRARRWVAVVAMGLIGAAAVLRAGLLLITPSQDPRSSAWQLGWAVLVAGVLLLAGAVTAAAIAAWQRRERIGRLAESLAAAPKPGTLAHELGAALGDPGLTMDYVTSDGRLVDQGGEVAAATEGPGRASGRVTTPIERDGIVLARVHHSATTDRAALAAAFGPTLLVALDNERLRATQLAHLLELRRSRSRIVAVADAARRRLERDLHDGVQQQLIAVLFDLRSLRLRFDRAKEAQRAADVLGLEARAQSAVDELRRIAHGIHPAILSRSGLEAALASLADESPVPIELGAHGLGRLPEAVEAAAYAVASELVADATRRVARAIAITAHREAGWLRLEVRDDGATEDSPPLHLVDRVEASGGTIAVVPTSSGASSRRVELPCE